MKVSVLIDSHGWIEYFSDGPLASKYAKYVETANPSEAITPATTLYEVYKKLKVLKGESIALEAIAYIIKNTAIIPIGRKISLRAAEVSIRTKLAMADALVKAVADEKNAIVITGDSDFKGMENVRFID